MHAAILRSVLFKNRRQMLSAKVERYRTQDRETIERLQVAQFNAVWSYCLSDVPFYRTWAREHDLPDRIDRPSDLAAFPTLTKQVIVERSDEIFQGGTVRSWVTTGGSTGEPARYPVGTTEAGLAWANMYLGRGWWGIRPFDEHVMIWGHSHLFGTGLKGRIAQAKRKGADRVLNITRLNAYDMTEQALESHFLRLRRGNPLFMVGYTSGVFRLARYIEANGLALQVNRLRGVVLTSETVSDADIDTVERVFRAPAIIEYGAAETGVIAYSRDKARTLQVFWDSFICLRDAGGVLSLTTITPRLFPLVNYEIGDVVGGGNAADGSVLTFDSVLGRKQDVIKVAAIDGRELELSAILPVHILKGYTGVRSVAFEQHDASVSVFVETDGALDSDDIARYFARELRKDHPSFDPHSVKFLQTAEQQKTPAGKHRLVRVPTGKKPS
jgi:phenylacetate-coenzyme A ligase PaaK-like adenylate-forming protein